MIIVDSPNVSKFDPTKITSLIEHTNCGAIWLNLFSLVEIHFVNDFLHINLRSMNYFMHIFYKFYEHCVETDVNSLYKFSSSHFFSFLATLLHSIFTYPHGCHVIHIIRRVKERRSKRTLPSWFWVPCALIYHTSTT